MGGIRTARPIYQDGCVMEFYVRKSEVFYKEYLKRVQLE